MERKYWAIIFCAFLSITPLFGTFFDCETLIGKFVGNYFPYISLSIACVDGFPFAEALAALFGLIVLTIAIVAWLIFLISKFNKTGGLKVLLITTIIDESFRLLVGLVINLDTFQYGTANRIIFTIGALLADIFWVLLCIWTVRALRKNAC